MEYFYLISLLFCASIINRAEGISKTELFPFGQVNGDDAEQQVTVEDAPVSVELTVPIVLYGKKYNTAYVSLHGIVTFKANDVSVFDHRPFPLSFAAIAPFYTDIVNEHTGLISFRESTRQELLDKANSLVHLNFPVEAASFQTRAVFVATWDDVAGHGNPPEWMNTFQLVVANSGDDSYAFFLYPTGNVVWAKTTSRIPGGPDAFAQAGFMSDDGKFTLLEGSGTDYMRNLPSIAYPEGGQEGVYAYHIGMPAPTADGTAHPEDAGGSEDDEEAAARGSGDSQPPTREPIDTRHPLDPSIQRGPRPTEDGAEAERDNEAAERVPVVESHASNGDRVSVESPPQTPARNHEQGNPACVNRAQCHASAECRQHAAGSCCECTGSQFYGNGKICIDRESAQRMNGQASGQLNGVDFRDALMHNYIVVQEGRVYVAFSPIPNEVGDSLQTLLPVASIIGWMFAITENGIPNGLTLTGGVFNHTATVRFIETGQSVHISQRFSGLDEQNMLHSVLYLTGTVPAVTAGQPIEFADHHMEFRRSGPGSIHSISRNSVKVGEVSHPYTVEESISYQECPHHQDANAAKVARLHISRVVSLYQQQERASRFGMDAKLNQQGAGGIDVCATVDCGPTAACVPQGDTARCMCSAGYESQPGSDPSSQLVSCTDIDECSTRNECSPQAECVNTPGSFMCRCLAGYSGDGRQCKTTEEAETSDILTNPAPEDSCDVANNCDANAECVTDYETSRKVCRCREGHTGDGYRCSPARPIQPDQGQKVPPPGSCYYNPGQCDRHAACIPDERTGYSCQCLVGFEGDGLACRAKPTSRGGFLAFTQGMSVVKLPADRSSLDRGGQIAMVAGQTAVGIAVDCIDNHIYWSDIAGNTINRAHYDGSDIEVMLRNVLSAEGIAIDFISRNIFWTDSANDHIAVAKLTDTKAGQKIIINKNLSNPRAIAVHPARGSIFWTDWNRLDPKIETASMDGTDRRTLINRDLGLPNALTVDFTTDDLCWADAGNQKIECISINGDNRRMIFFGASYPFSMTLFGSQIYWTDWTENKIMSVSKSGGQAQVHELPIGSSGKVYGIASVPEQCPRLTNACLAGNGGCAFICLPLPNGRHQCVCPDSISVEQCGTGNNYARSR